MRDVRKRAPELFIQRVTQAKIDRVCDAVKSNSREFGVSLCIKLCIRNWAPLHKAKKSDRKCFRIL